MYRKIMGFLEAWKDSVHRKPLILQGARQVGKTYSILEFGRTHYENVAYFNFETNPKLNETFEENISPDYLIPILSHIAGQTIVKEKTLMVFDEVQLCERALTSLKYFCENAPDYHIIVAGSLLGVAVNRAKFSFPVGKVDMKTLYPMDMEEFMLALGEDDLVEQIKKCFQTDTPLPSALHDAAMQLYRQYLVVGGMPECVASWKQYKDPNKVLRIQRELIEIYENDFSKHNGKVNSGRILQVFRSIVPQLAKANEKFMYGVVREGARARDFEEAIEWLVSAGMLNRVYNTAKPEHPLPAFDKSDQFKLFLFDTGLLKCMAGIDNSAILLKSDYQFKGPLTENYVLQQLQGLFDVAPRYYADKRGEIDFVLQNGTEIIPVEVKAGEDKSAPSFKRYIAEHAPRQAIRFSKRGYRRDGSITNIPLYLVRKTKELL